jgi:hypothetical protein
MFAAQGRGSILESLKLAVDVADTPTLSKGSSLPDLPSGVNERIIRSLEKLFDEGGFPPNDGDEGGGGGGGGNERFKILDATAYCNMLDNFANGAATRRSERLARHSADEYIELMEKEYERTIKMQKDRKRARLEKSCGFLEDNKQVVPDDPVFIAMRDKGGPKSKVTALFSLEQSPKLNFRNWLIRFMTQDPSAIAPRLEEKEDPWESRYKLANYLLSHHQTPLFIERRYIPRDFWYYNKSEGSDS